LFHKNIRKQEWRIKSMKAEDILKEEAIPEEECGVCLLHEKEEEKLGNNIECPHCKKYIPIGKIKYDLDTAIVGETNYYTKEQNVEKCLLPLVLFVINRLASKQFLLNIMPIMISIIREGKIISLIRK
jgi:hypothetical protein